MALAAVRDSYHLLSFGAGNHDMPTVPVNARIDRALKEALDRYCREHGVVMNHFIQEAILDRLEELEDIEDLKSIRHEPTKPFAEVLKIGHRRDGYR